MICGTIEVKDLVMRVLDEQIEYKDRKPNSFVEATEILVMERVGALVAESGKLLSVRNAVPLLPSLMHDPYVQKTVAQACVQYGILYTEAILYDAIGMTRAALLDSGTSPIIRSIRNIGGKNAEVLLGSLLHKAKEQGIERHSLEPKCPREIHTSLSKLLDLPPQYMNPEIETLANDDYQISDLLQREALRELGLPLDSLS